MNENIEEIVLPGKSLKWRVNTVGLLTEIIEHNPSLNVLHKPINIFKDILGEVAQRATEINDPKLNCLMIRLSLYDVSDPNNPEYNYEFIDSYLKAYEE